MKTWELAAVLSTDTPLAVEGISFVLSRLDPIAIDRPMRKTSESTPVRRVKGKQPGSPQKLPKY